MNALTLGRSRISSSHSAGGWLSSDAQVSDARPAVAWSTVEGVRISTIQMANSRRCSSAGSAARCLSAATRARSDRQVLAPHEILLGTLRIQSRERFAPVFADLLSANQSTRRLRHADSEFDCITQRMPRLTSHSSTRRTALCHALPSFRAKVLRRNCAVLNLPLVVGWIDPEAPSLLGRPQTRLSRAPIPGRLPSLPYAAVRWSRGRVGRLGTASCPTNRD